MFRAIRYASDDIEDDVVFDDIPGFEAAREIQRLDKELVSQILKDIAYQARVIKSLVFDYLADWGEEYNDIEHDFALDQLEWAEEEIAKLIRDTDMVLMSRWLDKGGFLKVGSVAHLRDSDNWFDIWFSDKQSMLEVMNSNMLSDLAAGYSPDGSAIRSQRETIDNYRRVFESEVDSFKAMTEPEVNRWCFYDMKKRGVIE